MLSLMMQTCCEVIRNNTTTHQDRRSAPLTVNRGTSGGCEDTYTVEARRVPDCRNKATVLKEVNQGTVEMVVSDLWHSVLSQGLG